MRRAIILGWLLAGVTLGLYWPLTQFGLVYYDDPLFLTDSPEIQSGLNFHSIAWAFGSVMVGNWHPLTTLSFVVDHQLFGTNPGAEHLVNVLLHSANAVLLFVLLRALTGSDWRSALVAAVFAWHPLRVESVAWITERKDVLSGLFFLLSLLAYARYVKAGETGGSKTTVYYALSLLAMALGLMSKAMLVSLPLVLLLLDFWPLQRAFRRVGGGRTAVTGGTQPERVSQVSERARPREQQCEKRCQREYVSFTNRLASWLLPFDNPPGGPPLVLNGPLPIPRLLWEKAPFLALAVGFSVLTFVVQKQSSAVVALNKLGWDYRIANAITSYLRYLGKLFYPVDLAVVYPYVRIDDWGQTGLIAVILAGVTVLCLRQGQRRPWLAMGWLWYLLMSLPIIGLVQVGETSMADRYTYLTLIGPVVALVWLIPEAWSSNNWGARPPRALRRTPSSAAASSEARAGSVSDFISPRPGPLLLATFCASGLLTLLLLTNRQLQYWRDSVTLFAHAIAVTPPNPGAENGLAIGLEHAGKAEEALAHYRRAESLNPTDPDNFMRSGRLLMEQKRWAEAADDTFQALALQPMNFPAHENLGVILPQLGRAGEGLDHWKTALNLHPNDPDLLNNLAWSLATNPDPALRDGPQAVALAEKACALADWQKTVFMGTLAAAYAESGRFDDAISTAQKACANATARGETNLLARNQELLARYQQHLPWHDPVPGP